MNWVNMGRDWMEYAITLQHVKIRPARKKQVRTSLDCDFTLLFRHRRQVHHQTAYPASDPALLFLPV